MKGKADLVRQKMDSRSHVISGIIAVEIRARFLWLSVLSPAIDSRNFLWCALWSRTNTICGWGGWSTTWIWDEMTLNDENKRKWKAVKASVPKPRDLRSRRRSRGAEIILMQFLISCLKPWRRKNDNGCQEICGWKCKWFILSHHLDHILTQFSRKTKNGSDGAGSTEWYSQGIVTWSCLTAVLSWIANSIH